MDISESTKAKAKEQIDVEVRELELFEGYFQSFLPREQKLIKKLIEERARWINLQDAVRRVPV